MQLRVVKDLPEASVISSLLKKETVVSEEKDGIAVSSNVEKPSCNDDMEILSEERGIAAKAVAVASETVSCSEVTIGGLNSDVAHHESLGKRKVSKCTNTVLGESTLVSDDIQGSSSKKHKKLSALDSVTAASEGKTFSDNISNDKSRYLEMDVPDKNEIQMNTNCALNESAEHMQNISETEEDTGDEVDAIKEKPELKQSSKSSGVEGISGSSDWKPFEKELYLKGVEMYGRNRYRNLSFMLTCPLHDSFFYIYTAFYF